MKLAGKEERWVQVCWMLRKVNEVLHPMRILEEIQSFV